MRSFNHNDAVTTYVNQERTARELLTRAKQDLDTAKRGLADLEKARGIAQTVAQAVEQQAHKRITGLVTSCLTAVFPDGYTFDIIFERKRGKTEAKMVFLQDGEEVDPTTAAGGGVLDIAAFALRVAVLVLSYPQRRRLLVLDEPFKFLSEEYRGMAAALIEKLADELGIQFIIVTHIKELQLGKVVEL